MRLSRLLPFVCGLVMGCAASPAAVDGGANGPDSGISAPDGGAPTDGGTQISCDPATVAEFMDTCLGAAFSCFSPSGSCTSTSQIGTDTSLTTYTWTGGETVTQTGGPDAPYHVGVSSSGGTACASVEAAHGGNACAQGQSTFEILNASMTSVATLCWVAAGPSVVLCANGSSLTVENNSMNQILDCLPIAPAVAQCTAQSTCPAGDAGPSPACCQPNGNICNTGNDCCSGNCITRGSPGFCCQAGGCP